MNFDINHQDPSVAGLKKSAPTAQSSRHRLLEWNPRARFEPRSTRWAKQERSPVRIAAVLPPLNRSLEISLGMPTAYLPTINPANPG